MADSLLSNFILRLERGSLVLVQPIRGLTPRSPCTYSRRQYPVFSVPDWVGTRAGE